MKNSIIWEFILILVVVLGGLAIYSHLLALKEKKDAEPVPYIINIVDEHEVRLMGIEKDSIVLYFENASVLSDEYIVFVQK